MLSFVGCGAAFNPMEKNCNAFFFVEDRLYLLDCGETSFEMHVRLGNLHKATSITVLVTHMHADHVGSLGSLIAYNAQVLGGHTTVVYPDPVLADFLTMTGVPAQQYTHLPTLASGDACVEARAVPVRHVEMLKAYGYLLAVRGSLVYYSGDAGEIPAHILALLRAGELDALYQDTCLHPHGEAHLSFDALCKLVAPEYRHKVFCMHYDTEYRAEIERLGFRTIHRAG